MFKTKNPANKTTENKEKKSPFTSAKSWIEGQLGSLLIGSAIGYSLYHFGIINKIKNYLTKKPSTPIFSDGTNNSNTQTQG